MERSSLVVNGGTKLPIGYRFHPTDEELVVHYLRRKVFGLPLPASVIPELDVLQTHPFNLPGDLKEKRYFFSKKFGHESENESRRAGGSGYWKSIGKSRPIISSFGNHIVGIKKTLIFREKKNSNDIKTQLVMQEYCLIGSGTTILNTNSQGFKKNIADWVVYTIFQKKRRPKKRRIVSKSSRSCVMDFIVAESSEQPCSPCYSGITEVSSNGLDQEEINSPFISSANHSCKNNT